MRQSEALVTTLKKLLKRQGKTYKDVATALDLSEASVKRVFAEQSFTLQRLESVTEFLGLELSELMQLSEEDMARTEQLTVKQEKELVSDVRLLLTAVLLINHWSFEKIIEHYRISEHEAIRLMAKLDRMKLIQLLPGNRVKLIISRNFDWIPNGPIQQFYEKNVQPDFLNCSFNKAGECRLFLHGMISDKSNAELLKKIQRLADEFNQYHEDDMRLDLDDRHGSSLIIALRPWELNIFSELRKNI